GTLPLQLPAGARVVAAGVNGRRLEGPSLSAEKSGPYVTLELTVPALAPGGAREAVHSFEVVYETDAPAGEGGLAPWARLEAAGPRLPVAPTSSRRRWRLPPGLAPLWAGSARRLPGSGAGHPRPRALTDLFRLGPPLPLHWPRQDDRAERRQALADAAA